MLLCFPLSRSTQIIQIFPFHCFTPSYWQTSSSYHQPNVSTYTAIWKSLSFRTFFHLHILFFPFCVLKPMLLPTSCILSQMRFFHTSSSTFILRFTISFTLASLSQIGFTKSINPNLLHICLHHAHQLELHLISTNHALPISDIRCSSNTTLTIHFTIAFPSLSSKVLHPVSPLISSFLTFPRSQSHLLPIPFCFTSKSSHSCRYHANTPQHTLACLPPYSSILLYQLPYFPVYNLHPLLQLKYVGKYLCFCV